MTAAYSKHFSTRETPQTEKIPGSSQVPNSAGGFSFPVDDWTRLDRFLILGSEGGSYYASEQKLTVENATGVTKCLDENSERTIARIVEISQAGRAPKNDPAIFALAIAAGHNDPATRRCAEAAIPFVCRIGTHIFQFAEAVQNFRGWGRGLRKAIANWYESKTPDDLAFQVAKYQSRNGWSHRDLLRLCHASNMTWKPDGDLPAFLAHEAVLRWAVGGKDAITDVRTVKRGESEAIYSQEGVAASLPKFLSAVDEAKTASEARIVRLILDERLPRECIPTQHLNSPQVWDALLQGMPLMAMVRNLGKMSAVGLLKPFAAGVKVVTDRLADREHIHKSRLHPLAILLAGSIYGQGHGDKGKLKWDAVPQIKDALDEAFYLAFANVEPTNKRTLLCLDVSGSMGGSTIAGTALTCREGAAALAVVTARTEPQHAFMAFANQFMPLDISAKMSLRDVVAKTGALPFMGTDCSLPMLWALEKKVPVDTFIVVTDSETYAGRMHPSQALVQYRQKMGIPAKSIVVGMVSNGFTIADPNDAGMMDVVGFDASAPIVMADFAR